MMPVKMFASKELAVLGSKRQRMSIPICEKVTLTIKEASEYSNIGVNKIESLLKSPRCSFVLYVGRKKLVKRKEFEKFIATSVEI